MSLASDLTALNNDITAVVNDILAAQYLGDVPAASIAQLTPANLGNGAWSPFQLVAGGDAILTTSSVDGILCKLIVAGNVNIVTDFSHTTARIEVNVGGASGTQLYNSTQHSSGSTSFYEEIFLFYASISGNTQMVELSNFNTTSSMGSYSPGTGTPSFYISGGFDYSSPATYSASNNFTITEFRVVVA